MALGQPQSHALGRWEGPGVPAPQILRGPHSAPWGGRWKSPPTLPVPQSDSLPASSSSSVCHHTLSGQSSHAPGLHRTSRGHRVCPSCQPCPSCPPPACPPRVSAPGTDVLAPGSRGRTVRAQAAPGEPQQSEAGGRGRGAGDPVPTAPRRKGTLGRASLRYSRPHRAMCAARGLPSGWHPSETPRRRTPSTPGREVGLAASTGPADGKGRSRPWAAPF